MIQADEKTELPPQTQPKNPTKRSTAGTTCIADTIEVQRRRGLPTNGGTLGSPRRRSKPVRTRRGPISCSRQLHSLVGGNRRKRLLGKSIDLSVDTGVRRWGQSPGVSAVLRISGPITNVGRFVAIQLSRLAAQIVVGFHWQMGLQVLGVQRLNADGWFWSLSWSRECRNGVLHRSEVETFITPLRWLVGWLGNAVESGYRFDWILEW